MLLCSYCLLQTPHELAWLASWAGSLAALGLALPAPAQSQLLALARQRRHELRAIDRDQLARAFAAWRCEEGLALLQLADAAAASARPPTRS